MSRARDHEAFFYSYSSLKPQSVGSLMYATIPNEAGLSESYTGVRGGRGRVSRISTPPCSSMLVGVKCDPEQTTGAEPTSEACLVAAAVVTLVTQGCHPAGEASAGSYLDMCSQSCQ